MISVEPLVAGHRLQEYVVNRVLGQGGFGTTYLCTDRNLQRSCVLKEFAPHGLVARKSNGDVQPIAWRLRSVFAKARTSFMEEARQLARFSHPNIVRVNRFFEAHNTAYFVMDYEAGGSLRSLLKDQADAFSESEIAGVIVPLCKGLDELHKAGLIHRDIKPENIIIRSDGSPALIDFGAVAAFQGQGTSEIEVIATPAYAPIEQFNPRAPQGPWIDIYALGAVIYELVAGYPPTSSHARLKGDPFVEARQFARGKYSDRLLDLIDKCLAMDFSERPKSVAEVQRRFDLNRDELLRPAIHDISWKMLTHFLNWAKPNEGLFCDEIITFVIIFPIIDLSWRIGEGLPDKETFRRLLGLMSPNETEIFRNLIVEKGFRKFRRQLTPGLVQSRLDEYAATYLLDRQAGEWTYEMTRAQVARNCLAPEAATDIPEFSSLMEDVIDRARSRVKKELGKILRKVVYRKVPEGWIKEIVDFS